MGWSARVRLRTADVGRSLSVSGSGRRVARITESPTPVGVFGSTALALLAVIVLALVPVRASAAASSAEFFGTNFSTWDSVGAAGKPVMLGSLRDSRMTLNRIDVHWDRVQSSETGGYDWTTVDSVIGPMASFGLRASPLFRFPPTWAGDGVGNRLVPDHYDEFGKFIAAFAKRYGPPVRQPNGSVTGGDFWAGRTPETTRPVRTYELWNEVNLDEYAWSTDGDVRGNADPAAYAAMAKVVTPIIKQTLPSAIVLGSLSWKDRPEEAGTDAMVTSYVPKFAAQGGLEWLDGMGYHPYAPDAQATIDLVIRLRQQLAAAGYPQMPIYADEAGQEAVTIDPSNGKVAPTNRAAANWAFELFPTDAARGANIAFAGEALAASDCGVKQFLPYGASATFAPIYDPGANVGLPRTEAWMGLYFNSGQPTQTALALQRASARWAKRFDAGGPGAPAPLALCSGGESPAASKLPIDAVFTATATGCVKVVTTYDGNPLESAYLRFYDPANGNQVALARTNTRGEAEQCVPWDLVGRSFRVVANIGEAGTTGVLECDVPAVGCPIGVALRPSAGTTLSARTATGYVTPPGGDPQPGATKPCTWKVTLAPGKFKKDKRGSRGRQQVTASVTCNTATAGTKVRFQVLRRAAKGGKEKLVKTVWLTLGKPRVLGVPAMKKGERVVVLHRAEPTIGIPRLRESLPVGAKVRPPVKARR